ncbi:hypothetical protein R6Q59_008794 [Mikania micrantha]
MMTQGKPFSKPTQETTAVFFPVQTTAVFFHVQTTAAATPVHEPPPIGAATAVGEPLLPFGEPRRSASHGGRRGTAVGGQGTTASNKYVEALRSAPLPYPEICIHLFEGSTSIGFDSWGPSSTLPHPVEEVSDYNLNGLESIECTQIEPPTQGVSEESSGQSKKKEKNERLKRL